MPPNIRTDAIPELIGAIRMQDLMHAIPQVNAGIAPPQMSDADKASVSAAASSTRQEGNGNVAALNAYQMRGAPLAKDGSVITLAKFRSAYLTSIGEGKYAISLEDPTSNADPKWSRSNDTKDDRFVLDLKALKPVLKDRVPEAYLPE